MSKLCTPPDKQNHEQDDNDVCMTMMPMWVIASRSKLYLSLSLTHEEQAKHLDSSGDGQDDEPEPEEDIDLLVDDVEREDAESVKLLHRPGRTKLVECALGHLKQMNYKVR